MFAMNEEFLVALYTLGKKVLMCDGSFKH